MSRNYEHRWHTWTAGVATLTSLLLLLSGCGDDPTGPEDTSDLRLQQDITAVVDSMVNVLGVPGAAVMLESTVSGLRIETASGVREAMDTPSDSGWTGQAMTTRASTRIGSVTKSFTAVLILKLAEHGSLDLDSTIARYLPDCPLPNATTITLRHLLTMRSGLNEYLLSSAFQEQWPPPAWSLDDLIDLAAAMGDALFEPGEFWMYSNTNYAVLARIAEEVTGLPYGEALAEWVLEPADLADSYAPGWQDASLPEHHLCGYAPPGAIGQTWTDVTNVPPDYVAGSGNVVSTLPDLLRWLTLLRGGGLMSDEMHDQMWTLHPTGIEGIRYGMGVVESDLGRGHNGSVVGYQTALYEWETWRLAVMVNGNTRLDDEDHGVSADAIARAVEQVLLEH